MDSMKSPVVAAGLFAFMAISPQPSPEGRGRVVLWLYNKWFDRGEWGGVLSVHIFVYSVLFCE